MSDKEIMLYVWEGKGVLTDYTDGLAFAIAGSLEEAIALASGGLSYVANNLPFDQLKIYPVTEPFGTYVWGGS